MNTGDDCDKNKNDDCGNMNTGDDCDKNKNDDCGNMNTGDDCDKKHRGPAQIHTVQRLVRAARQTTSVSPV